MIFLLNLNSIFCLFFILSSCWTVNYGNFSRATLQNIMCNKCPMEQSPCFNLKHKKGVMWLWHYGQWVEPWLPCTTTYRLCVVRNCKVFLINFTTFKSLKQLAYWLTFIDTNFSKQNTDSRGSRGEVPGVATPLFKTAGSAPEWKLFTNLSL